MILRRIIEHVKHQNWTAIALDFVIVVMGVFIGFQANDWRERQQEHARDQASLALLLTDIDQMIVAAEDDLNAVNEQIDLLLEAAELLSDCSADEDERRRLTEIFFGARVERRINIQRAGLNAVSDTGTMGRLNNQEFAKAIGRIDSLADYTRAAEPNYAAEHDVTYANIWSVMRVSGKVTITEEDGTIELAGAENFMAPFDVEAFCASEDASRALVDLIDYFLDKKDIFLPWKEALIHAKTIAEGMLK